MPSQPWALQEISLDPNRNNIETPVLIGIYSSLKNAMNAAPSKLQDHWYRISKDGVFYSAKLPNELVAYRIIRCPWNRKIPYKTES